MFRYGTTFVIGAGASAEFAMPVGTELAGLIQHSALLANLGSRDPKVGDETLYANFSRLWPRTNMDSRKLALTALSTINKGIHTAVSIDAFIDRFSDDPYITQLGKMLIALEISKAERESSLSDEHWQVLRENPKADIKNKYGKKLVNPDDTWLGHFFRILCDGVRNPMELGNNIRIICFNMG
ncbi:hypothetical protein I6F07_33060 [Ensifer sp. IC4062]|nr:hypothetical protein [Ensifer sp. IC4062]MCA1444898.1 hypothetical protein [Ensifer sp. IC4062]